MNLDYKMGEILECFGFMAGCHPKEAEKVKNKLKEIVKEAHKEMRHACAENVGSFTGSFNSIQLTALHAIIMNTNLDT